MIAQPLQIKDQILLFYIGKVKLSSIEVFNVLN